MMLYQQVREKVAAAGIMFLFTLLAISYLFGFEPQVKPHYVGHITAPNFQDYLSRSIEQNGDTVPVRMLATVAYPGAVSGVWVHNQFFRQTR